MSSAHTTPKAAAAPLDRRSHPRETPEWLALVFLDADNWGKLHNLSETGMAFEFSQPVSLRTSSTFVLESIRLMSAQDGDLTLNSIQTPGQIVWADESGRTAGVRFTDDSAETRLQIQSWLSGKPLPVAPVVDPQQPSPAGELPPAVPLGSLELEPLSLHSLAPSESKPIPEFDVLPVSERHAQDVVSDAAPLAPDPFPAIIPVEQPSRETPLPLLSGCAPSPEALPQLEPTPASLGTARALPWVDLTWLRPESPELACASSHPEPRDPEHLQLPFDQLPISGHVACPVPSNFGQAAEPSVSVDSAKPTPPAAPVEHALAPTVAMPADLSPISTSAVSEPLAAMQPAAFLSARDALTIHAPSGLHLSRFTILALAVTFAAVTAAVALTFAWPHRARFVALLSNLRAFSARNSAPPSAGSATKASAQAEMLDNIQNKPMSSAPKSTASQVASVPAVPASRFQRPQPEAIAKRASFPAIRLAAPVFSTSAKPVTVEDAPSVASGVSVDTASSRDPLGGLLANSRQPAPAAPETPPPPHAEALAPVVGGHVELPRLISSVPPVYPSIAASRHIEGDVTIDALIDTSGRVSETKVVSGTVLLRQAALDALRQWRYQPARLDGQTTSIHMQVTVKFRAK